jgi:hypothetical protein
MKTKISEREAARKRGGSSRGGRPIIPTTHFGFTSSSEIDSVTDTEVIVTAAR